MDVQKKVPKITANLTPSPPVSDNGGGSTASIAPLITMLIVLAIILIFCFCGAPAVRGFCRRRVCWCCPEPDEENPAGSTDSASNTPTIILLPFGRMLVVDRSVFAQFAQTAGSGAGRVDETSGLDFMELSANLIRSHYAGGGTPSLQEDSENESKWLSQISLGASPPAYEDIFLGTWRFENRGDLPPSYSEVSLMLRGAGPRPTPFGNDIQTDSFSTFEGFSTTGLSTGGTTRGLSMIGLPTIGLSTTDLSPTNLSTSRLAMTGFLTSSPMTTLPITTTTLPTATTTLPTATTTLPMATTTLPMATTTLPMATTTLPMATTALPMATTALPMTTLSITTLPVATLPSSTSSLSSLSRSDLSLCALSTSVNRIDNHLASEENFSDLEPQSSASRDRLECETNELKTFSAKFQSSF